MVHSQYCSSGNFHVVISDIQRYIIWIFIPHNADKTLNHLRKSNQYLVTSFPNIIELLQYMDAVGYQPDYVKH